MRGSDVLTDALLHALAEIGGPKAPVAVLNATGHECNVDLKYSIHACNKTQNTINSVFNTVLIRATRQNDETLGLIALAIAHATPQSTILIAQENAHGASSLEKNLRMAFPDLRVISKHKCRTMILEASNANKTIINKWELAAALRFHEKTGFWTQPGLFSWDRLDTASTLLLSHLPPEMGGYGADLGCGYGYLAVNLAKKAGLKGLFAVDYNENAVKICQKNLEMRGLDALAKTIWADVTLGVGGLPPLDWVVTNPPFHNQQHEDRELGQKFCTSALKMLKSGGTLYLVANKHMPYETLLEKGSKKVETLAVENGFKILKAVKS